MKVVKPYIERPFFPQEVTSVETPAPKPIPSSEMSTAILVGPSQRSNGQVDEVRIILNSEYTIRTLQCTTQ